MSTVPAPASAAEALAMIRAGMGYLAAADPTAMAVAAQAECLQTLEHLDAVETAARARILAAFTASQGYAEDADYSPASWLIHRTRITKGAARGHIGWARRAAAHAEVLVALAEGTVLSESMARTICGWTDRLPEDYRPAADAILVAAARAGARKEDLAALAAEIYARSLPDDQDDDPDPAFEDRQLRVETTFAGAGVISGDLTPECAAIVTAVLESLSAPQGAEDTRTKDQRYHDALQDAMRRLVASGLLPERAGQPVKVWAHISLAELRALDDGSVLQQEWIGEIAIRWAARRAAASQTGGDGAAWLDGKPARAISCDATMIPVVTSGIDPAALDKLVSLCLQYAGHGSHCRPGPGPDRRGQPGQPADPPGAAGQAEDPNPAGETGQPADPSGASDLAAERSGDPDLAADPSGGSAQPADPSSDPDSAADPSSDPDSAADPPNDPTGPTDPPGSSTPCPPGPRPPTPQAEEMLRHAIIRTAINLVSGPGGLASFLRTRLLGARFAGPSLPLDVGHSAEIPAAIRRAVILRDQHCRWAGGCDQPAAACEVHHVTHLADGGTTSVDGCALYCFYHHHVAIHQQGWTVALHPDGTTTARSPDGTKIFRSHSPPARAG